MLHRRGLLLLALLALLVSGCTHKETSNGVTVASYDAWVGVVAILGGIVASIVGWFGRKGGDWRSWLFLIFAVLGTIGFAPFGFVDYVKIDSQRIQTRWGFWIVPTVHDIALDQVTQVSLEKVRSSSRRGPRYKHYLDFHKKGGAKDRLPADNSLMEAVADELRAALDARNISVVNNTGE